MGKRSSATAAPRIMSYRSFPRRVSLPLLPLAGLLDLARSFGYAMTIARSRIGADRGVARLGALWWILDPLLQIGAWFIFIALVKGDPAHPEHAVALAAGVAPWRMFHNVALGTGDGYVAGAALLQIPRLPRLTMPLAAALEACFQSLFTIMVMLVLVGIIDSSKLLQPQIWLLAPLFLLDLLLAIGFGLILAAILPFSVDLRRFTRNGFRILFFATPVLYSLDSAPAGLWRDLLSANPLSPLFEAFRAALGSGAMPEPMAMIIPGVWAVALCALGAGLCRRVSGLVAAVV